MQTCPAWGSRSSRIALIGEAPASNEIQTGTPFVGASGKLLWHILEECGVDRSECYVTNVIKSQAPRSPMAQMPQSELDLWRYILRAELDACNANIFVAMGATALWAICDERSISEFRGYITDGTTFKSYNGRKTIATFHPASLLYQPSNISAFCRDIQMAVVQSFSPDIKHISGNYIINPTLHEAAQHIELARRSGRIAFDIETNRGIVTCVSIAYNGPTQLYPHCSRTTLQDSDINSMSVPLYGKKYWSSPDFAQIINILQSLFQDSSVTKVGQNVSYDIIGLRSINIEVLHEVEDIMHIHHAYDPLDSHSLAHQASMESVFPKWKDWEIFSGSTYSDSLYEYNAKDSFITLWLHNRYTHQWPQTVKFYRQHYKPVLPRLIQMHEDGICVDKIKQKQLANEFRTKADSYSRAIALRFGLSKFNLNSSAQLKTFLYDELRLPKQFNYARGRGKTLTADDDALVQLYLQTQDVYLLMIRDAKEMLKFASFLDPKSKDAQRKRQMWDDRLRCEYKMTTGTGRLSSSASASSRLGINLQNIPQPIRSTFVPAPGCVFLEADYMQNEARIIAWDSRDDAMIDLFEQARIDPQRYDVHWHNAEIIMERPRSELTRNDRNTCKSVVYGTYYDMQAKLLQETILKRTDPPLYIPLDECERRQQIFKQRVPKLVERQERIRNEVLTTGQQVSPTGQIVKYHDIPPDRLKYYFGRRDYNEVFRSAYSMVPQNVASRMVGRALVGIDQELRSANIGRVCLQVHDSLMMEVLHNTDSIMSAFRSAKRWMEEPFDMHGRPMIVPVEFKFGTSWDCECKEIYMEDDLCRAIAKLT